MTDHYDIIIIGGGLVGASMAVALDNTPLQVAVVEPYTFDDQSQPSYDERTVALTYSAKKIYTGMRVWPKILALGAEPIKDIHVSDKGHFGITHLSHEDAGTEALGYVVPSRVIGQALNARIQQSDNITLISPATATAIQIDQNQAEVTILKDKSERKITSSLIVVADGGRSGLLETEQKQHVYSQQALLTIVSTDRPHHGRAYERFTTEGPLALLPHSDQRYAVVWTSGSQQLAERMAMNDQDFIAALQKTFGDRAGNLDRPSPRKSYPLSKAQPSNLSSERMIMIGNAAHTVHPVAGQGFNLGLRDVADLADTLYQAHQSGKSLGDISVLNQYSESRNGDIKMVSQFTHGLIQLFSNDFKSLGLLRNIALKSVEHIPLAKRFLLRRTMGLNSQKSTLSRSLPLSSND